MNSTLNPSLASYLVLSGLIGFAIFCGSYAYHVWSKRNWLSRPDLTTHPVASKMRGLATAVFLLGLVLMAVTGILREVIHVEGTITGENITTVRALKQGQVEYVTEKPLVSAGELIVVFRSLSHISDYELARLQRQEYEAEKARTLFEPLQFDPEIVRSYENVLSKQNQLRASRDQLLPARDQSARQRIQIRVEKLERLAQVNVTMGMIQGELKEAFQKKTFLSRDLVRALNLKNRNMLSESEEDLHQKNVSITDAELSMFEKQINDLEEEKQQLVMGLKELESFSIEQLETYRVELMQLERKTEECAVIEKSLKASLVEDRKRAGKSREHELERLNAKVKQAEAKIDLVEQERSVYAAEPSKVYFREFAANSATEDEPLLVIGGHDAFRLKLRLRDKQSLALSRTKDVPIELCQHDLERRFFGRFKQATALASDPGYSVVEMACEPPATAVRAFTRGTNVGARLLWRPPLLTLPVFQLGGALALCGGLSLFFFSIAMSKRQTDRSRTEPAENEHIAMARLNGFSTMDQISSSERYSPQRQSDAVEYGAVGPILGTLAVQLYDMVGRSELDPALLGAVEWSLDRHHVRAIKVLSGVFRNGKAVRGCLMSLQTDVKEGGSYAMDDADHQKLTDLYDRLIRILRVVNPDLLAECFSDNELSPN